MVNHSREIRSYLKDRGFAITEGSASPAELDYMSNLIQRFKIKTVAEIGFNAGFSSAAFLSAAPNVKVLSFDIGTHDYTPVAKEWIDKEYPGRHTIIYGNSLETVPDQEGRHEPFDLLFIDGGHSYKVAKGDIGNMWLLSHTNSLVLIDDIVPWRSYGKGPHKAWGEAIEKCLVEQIEVYQDGQKVEAVNPPGTRAWALGRYRRS